MWFVVAIALSLILAGDTSVMEDVQRVNIKYNSYEYITDQEHFGKADYWQNPYEFSTYKKGDCEDYAIAKYYDLMNIGMPEDRLLVVYGRHIPNDEAHMVLFVMIGNEWFVMDNITDVIKPVRQRTDIEFVYGFNTITNFDMRHAKWREFPADTKGDPTVPVKRLKRLLKKLDK